MTTAELFAARRADSSARLQTLREDLAKRLGAIERTFHDPEACIYATGSLARHEATAHSDLDAFFVLSGSADDQPLSRIRDVKILAAVVEASDNAGFPDFSGDGEFLRFLHVEDIVRHIGDREDDYHNSFTARMLMILESTYLYNNELYRRFKRKLIDAYFEDFHDHSKSFRPIFLLNDVLRFWRTMCLNYESGRQWRTDNAEKSAKGHLANLKLKFSRLNICFSFVAHLLNKGSSLTPDDVVSSSELTPLNRLADLSDCNADLHDIINDMLDGYAWFLDITGNPKVDVLTWIAQESQRVEAFQHANRFVERMGDVVRTIADKNGYLRYLII